MHSKSVGGFGRDAKRILRNGTIAVAAASAISAHTVGAQEMQTNIVNSSTSISLRWEPQASDRKFTNVDGSQTFGQFNPALGTLNSVELSLTISYNVVDVMYTDGSLVAVASAIPLGPSVKALPFLSTVLNTNIACLSGGPFYAQPAAMFWDYTTSPGQTNTQSGTLAYAIDLDPIDLVRPLTVSYSLPNSSTLSPFTAVQDIALGIPDVNFIAKYNINENVMANLSEIYTTYTTPSLNQFVPANVYTNFSVSSYFTDFGEVQVGTATNVVLTYVNTGRTSAAMIGVVGFYQSPGDPTNLDFQVIGANANDLVNPKDTRQVTVICNPVSAGDKVAKLILYGPDGSAITTSFHVTGLAAAPALRKSPGD